MFHRTVSSGTSEKKKIPRDFDEKPPGRTSVVLRSSKSVSFFQEPAASKLLLPRRASASCCCEKINTVAIQIRFTLLLIWNRQYWLVISNSYCPDIIPDRYRPITMNVVIVMNTLQLFYIVITLIYWLIFVLFQREKIHQWVFFTVFINIVYFSHASSNILILRNLIPISTPWVDIGLNQTLPPADQSHERKTLWVEVD